MDIFEQLKRDEGYRKFVYADTEGIPTIGVGRNLRDTGLSDDEILLMLKNDVTGRTAALARGLSWFSALDEARQGVLINMSFMGIEKLLGFHKMLTFMEESNWQAASNELLNSKWAIQVYGRANRLAAQLTTGTWQ